MKTNRLYIVAALLGTVLAGCQKTEELKPEEKPESTKTLTLRISVDNIETKALALDGKKLKTSWALGEIVSVYSGSTWIGSLEVKSEATPTESALLEGTIVNVNNSLSAGSELTLLFPGSTVDETPFVLSYQGQDGSLATLASRFDYSIATLTIDTIVGSVVTASIKADENKFTNQQDVFRFGLNMTVDELTVSSSNGLLVTSRSYNGTAWETSYGSLTITPGTDPAQEAGVYNYYLSIRNDSNDADTFYFSYVKEDTGALYEGSKAIPASTSLARTGKYAGGTVDLAQKAFAPAASGTIATVEEVL